MKQLTIDIVSKNYLVTVDGNVYSKPRPGTKGGKLKYWIDKNGYYKVNLWVDGKLYQCSIHRLVAMFFIDNPNSFPQINHKNGIKTDNSINNLEWCTQQMNTRHAYDIGLAKSAAKGMSGYLSPTSIEIHQYARSGEHIKSYGSIREASRVTGIGLTSIIYCSVGKLKTGGGFIWKRN